MDYTASVIAVTILPIENMSCADIPIIDDNVGMEGDETFEVRISAPPNIPADERPSIVTIEDNDGESTVQLHINVHSIDSY